MVRVCYLARPCTIRCTVHVRHRGSHTMTKKQTLNLAPLAPALNSLVTGVTKGGVQKKKGKARPNAQRRFKAKSLALQVPRNQGLNLTSSQFTATSPLNLFSTIPGSTPGGTRVRGRELLFPVRSGPALTGEFALADSFNGVGSAGRGNPTAFQRLSSYTSIYEYFIFHNITYMFQSNQPTTATGEVILAVDYDPTDAPPGSTAAMMRNVSSTMSNIYSDNSLQVLKSLSRLPRYETSSAIDEKLQQWQHYLYVALEGVTAGANATFGYIVAEYDVEFFTPQ